MKKGLFLCLFVLAAIPATAFAGIADGLIAFYPFNGNANDESGNGNNAIVDGALLTTDRYDKELSAYHFDGINDSIKVPSISLPVGNQPRTISVFFKVESPLLLDQYIAGWGIEWDTPDSAFFLNVYREQYRFVVLHDDLSVGPVTADTWIHFAVSYDGSIAYVYVNGVLAGYRDSWEYNVNTYNTTGLLIGVLPNRDSPYAHSFKGSIDEVRVYDRALSAEEVYSLYMSPIEQVTTLANMVFSLNLKEGVSNALDSKLDPAIRALDDLNANNIGAACGSLQAFIHSVEAQSGKQIPAEDAAELIGEASRIKSSIGCL